MKRKFMPSVLFLICVLCLCLGVAACSQNTAENSGNSVNSKNSVNSGAEQNGFTSDNSDESYTQTTDKTAEEQSKEPAHVHEFSDYIYNNDATCTEDGTETRTCVCGVSGTRIKHGTALGHNFEVYISNNDATCTEDGTETLHTLPFAGYARSGRFSSGTRRAEGRQKGSDVFRSRQSRIRNLQTLR